MFAGEEPHVLVALRLFTKVYIKKKWFLSFLSKAICFRCKVIFTELLSRKIVRGTLLWKIVVSFCEKLKLKNCDVIFQMRKNFKKKVAKGKKWGITLQAA